MVTFFNNFFYTVTGCLIGHTCGIVYYLYASFFKNGFFKNNYNTITDYSTYGALIGGSTMYIIGLLNEKKYK